MESLNARELRIGNWIGFKENATESIVEILGINSFNNGSIYAVCTYFYEWMDIASFAPIPITEELLVKFGFEKRIINGLYPEYSIKAFQADTQLTLAFNSRKDSGGLDEVRIKPRLSGTIYGLIKEPKFIHELQNLYFILTGKELELK